MPLSPTRKLLNACHSLQSMRLIQSSYESNTNSQNFKKFKELGSSTNEMFTSPPNVTEVSNLKLPPPDSVLPMNENERANTVHDERKSFNSRKRLFPSTSLVKQTQPHLTTVTVSHFQSTPLPFSIASSPTYLIDIILIHPYDHIHHPTTEKWGIYIVMMEVDNILCVGSLNHFHQPVPSNYIHSRLPPHHYGLLPGDIIVSINNRPISTYGDFEKIVLDLKGSQRLHLQLIRCFEGTRAAIHVLDNEMKPNPLMKHFETHPTSYKLSPSDESYHDVRRELFSPNQSKNTLFFPKKQNQNWNDAHSKPKNDRGDAASLAAKASYGVLRNVLHHVMKRPSINSAFSHITNRAPFRLISKSHGIDVQLTKNDHQQQLKQKLSKNGRSTTDELRPSLVTKPQCQHPQIQQEHDEKKQNTEANIIPSMNAILPLNIKYSPNDWNFKTISIYRNLVWKKDIRLLRNATLKGSPFFDDNTIDIHDINEDGTRSELFLNSSIEKDYNAWLSKRKKVWRKEWNICPFDKSSDVVAKGYIVDGDHSSHWVESQFWLQNGHPTFYHWLAYSTKKWKRSYSWQKQKRRKLEKEKNEVVHFPRTIGTTDISETTVVDEIMADWCAWLRVRKSQWRVMRRKRQRKLEEEASCTQNCIIKDEIVRNKKCKRNLCKLQQKNAKIGSEISTAKTAANREKQNIAKTKSPNLQAMKSSVATSIFFHIDAHIEDEENQMRSLKSRPPLDISFIFFADRGAPDDVISYILSYLPPSDHGTLLCINFVTSQAIKERSDVWRTMCPKHWILPKRPRKPWHLLYISRLREEEEMIRKKSDDVLVKASHILDKGDHLHKLIRLVESAEKSFRFNVNYVSAIVLERNSILNLSVIHQRHRITKWLIEVKNVDIETFDRGNFTPLLNAAWAGDRYLVRYLLGKRANRTKVGTAHYSKGLAHPDFKGLTAEGWARKRGFSDLADLIQLGLS